MKSIQKYGILTCLYFAQGLPYGLFTIAVPSIMRSRGASLPEIGLASLLTLPWAFKFLWAPLVDRYGLPKLGIRKTWLLALQLIGSLVFFRLGMVEDTGDYTYLLVGFFLANLITATQDIATDGLAVSMLKPSERGVGNGIQVAGYRMGMHIGGGVLLMFFSFLGWQGIFIFMGFALLASTVPVLFYKEPPSTAYTEKIPAMKLLTDLVKRKGMLVWLGVIGFYKFGDAMATHMLKPFLVDIGLEPADFGKLLGTYGFLGGLLGALVGGLLVRQMGRYHAVFVLGVIQALAVFGYWLLGLGYLNEQHLTALCATEYFTGGMATAAIFTAMMDMCRPQSAATDYTLQASLVVIATNLSHVLSGYVAQAWGYNVNFALAGILSLAGAFLFGAFYKGQKGHREAMVLYPEPGEEKGIQSG